MTNYNDGNWWGWNGGECPVHPKSEVEVMLYNSSGSHTEEADGLHWRNDAEHLAKVIAFRVIRQYKEPREWWIKSIAPGGAMADCGKDDVGAIHVREVLE